MLVDFLSHALVVIAPLPTRGASDAWWSQFMFIGATSLSCVGAGVLPGMQSLALCTLQGRALATKEAAIRAGEAQEHDNAAELEPGKLFGALAVLQAIGQTILGVSDTLPFVAAVYSDIGSSAYDLWCHLQQHRSLLPKGHFRNSQWLGTALARVYRPRQARCQSLRPETRKGPS
jgi:hypothetical protein